MDLLNYYTSGNVLNLLKEKKFFCKIPRIYIYTDEEKELFGIPTDTVNGEIDNKSFFELVDSYKSIYELAKIAAEDRSILIKNDKDILEIYSIANRALEILRNAPNAEALEDYEDLIFGLTALINKIKNINEDYMKELIRENQRSPLEKKTFIKKMKEFEQATLGTAIVDEVKPKKLKKLSDIDFRKISL